MKIGLISDTHIATLEESIPQQIKTAFQGVDLILHAGDVWIPSVLDELETIAPVIAAWGDDDLENDLGNDPRMTKDMTLHIDGFTIWLLHVKPAYGIIVPRENRVFSRQPEITREIPDVVVYGHTHKVLVEKHKGTLIINPGSPNWPNHVPDLGTVAILTLESGKAEACIVPLE